MNAPDLYRKIEHHLAESARVKQAMTIIPPAAIAASSETRPVSPHVHAIAEAVRLIAKSLQSGGKLLLCGNGGSAADCQHMAADFVSRLRSSAPSRPALPALALTTDTSFLTAFSNDVGFADVFLRQVEALGRPGDVLIAISTSGNSENVLRAASAARALGIAVIALTGNGGRLGGMADIAIAAPHTDVTHIQEAHLAIEHVICDLVEQLLFPELRRPSGSASEPPEAV